MVKNALHEAAESRESERLQQLLESGKYDVDEEGAEEYHQGV
jgi:hypothetical protein